MDSYFSNLTADGKILFFLGLSEKVLSVFSHKEDQILAREVINKCWEWLIHKENIGEFLYEFLDNEESGITIIQEMSDSEVDDKAWNCIIDTVAYTSRKAFEKEGVKYYPEPIALVDDSLVDHFINCFEKCIEDSNSYIQKIITVLNDFEDRNFASDVRTELLKNLQ